MNIVIDPKLHELIPPLSAEERELLEVSIKAEGCRDALVIWQGKNTLLDGHNRYEICLEHGIDFNTHEIPLADHDGAKDWIIRNQFARRNLTAFQRAELALKLEPLIAVRGKKKQKEAGGAVVQKSVEPPVNAQKELAKVAGVSHDTIHKVKVIAEKAPEDIKAKLRRGEPGASVNSVYQNIVREEAKQKRAEQLKDTSDRLGQTEKLYRVFYADPPWKYREEQHVAVGDGQAKVLGVHYTSMSIEQLCRLPVAELAEGNAVLFLWVTSPLLEECFGIIRAWGFKYKTSMVWDKVKHNVGNYVSVRHELLLICTRGSCTPDVKKLHDSVQTIERTEHSRKPERFREIIDEIYPQGNRIELFARTAIKGWDRWGNE